MVKPNYRLNQVNVDEPSTRIVSSVGLRKSTGGVEDRTFCVFHCSCDPDKSHWKCGCNKQCSCDGDVPPAPVCSDYQSCSQFCPCVSDPVESCSCNDVACNCDDYGKCSSD